MNIIGNNIPAVQAQELIKVIESSNNLKTLCGFEGDKKELDLRNMGFGAECTVLVLNEIKDLGVLAKLDMSNNNTEWRSGKLPADQSPVFIRSIGSMLKAADTTIKEINLAGNNLNAEAGRVFSEGLHGALASLDISNNKLTQGKQTQYPSRRNDYKGRHETDMSGVIALAEVLKK